MTRQPRPERRSPAAASPLSSDRRQRKATAARKTLVDAALAQMGEQGVHDTRIADITEAADVAKGTFYAHFVSKAAVLAAAVDRVVSDLLELPPPRGLPAAPAARAAACVAAHLERLLENPGELKVLDQARGQLLLDPVGMAAVADSFSRYHQFWSRTLGDRRPQPGRVATGMLLGVAVGLHLHGSRADLLEAVEALTAAVEAMRS